MRKVKRKTKVKKHIIKIPLYNQILVLYTASNIKDVYNTMAKEYDIETTDDFSYASFDTIYNYKEGIVHFILSLPNKATLGTIAHECAHAAWRILEQAKFEPTADSQEPFTYLLDYIVEEVTKKMKL